uniref:Uncharacterized protein n=1 Tax=Theileria annulata TaxID=5874 RepID=A0A3B0MVG1_THEAN
MLKMVKKDNLWDCSTDVSEEGKVTLGQVVPDFIEFECTKTKMYKIIAESYCLKSPEYLLNWEIRHCKVDLNVKSPLWEGIENKGLKKIKHEATLHTLKPGSEINENYGKSNEVFGDIKNIKRNVYDDYYMGGRNGGYKPPKVYDLNGKEDLNGSMDIDSINDMEDFIKYINSNIV